MVQYRRSRIAQRRSTGKSVYNAFALGQPCNPDFLPGDIRRVSEKDKSPRQQRRVENVHACPPEYLLADNDRKGGRDSHHPQRDIDRHHQRDQHTCHEETFIDLVAADLRRNKFDPQPDHIRDDNDRQYFQETEPETAPQCGISHPDRAEMLQSHVIHPEQKTGHQGQDDNDHRPFEVHRIADMTAAVGSLVRDEKERLERIERRMQPAEAAARFEIGFYPV